MRAFFVRFYMQELGAWVLFTPLVCTFFSLFIIFGGLPIYASYFIVAVGFSAMCAVYFDQRQAYKKMTDLFPISKRTFLAVDFSFLSLVAVSYILYSVFIYSLFSSLMKQQVLFPPLNQALFLPTICLYISSLFIIIQWTKFRGFASFIPVLCPLFTFLSTEWINALTLSRSLLLLGIGCLTLIVSSLVTRYMYERRDLI